MKYKHEDNVDITFRQGEREIVHTVGELIDELKLLPRELGVGLDWDDGCRVGVVGIPQKGVLAVMIQEPEDD